MSTPDKYFGIGGNFRIDATGNRVPAESWPDDVIATSAPINTVIPPAPEPTPEPAIAKTTAPKE